jgi:hypothetical protein
LLEPYTAELSSNLLVQPLKMTLSRCVPKVRHPPVWYEFNSPITFYTRAGVHAARLHPNVHRLEPIPPPAIPEGWITYEFEEGRLAFAYPPQWTVSSSEPSEVELKVSADTFLAVEWVGERPMGLLPTEPVNLVTVLEDTGKTLGWKDFRFLDRGMLSTGVYAAVHARCAFTLDADSSWEMCIYRLVLFAGARRDERVVITYERFYANDARPEDREALDSLVRSVRFRP